jgi:putative membrane protein
MHNHTHEHAHDHAHDHDDPHKQKRSSIQWREWLQALILLGTGLYLTVLIITGNLANYINLSFQWLTVTGASLFMLMGIWQVWRMLRPHDDHEHHHDHGHDHDHDHENLSWGVMMIVAIPLMFGALVPSAPLGADAITGGVSLQPVGVGDGRSKPLNERNILDWLREFQNVSNPSALDGTPITVLGFIYREPFMDDNAFMVARFTLSCCVADAFAIGIPVIADDASAWETGTWVEIQGTLQAGEFDGDVMPIIRPNSIAPADQPDQPYLYS